MEIKWGKKGPWAMCCERIEKCYNLLDKIYYDIYIQI